MIAVDPIRLVSTKPDQAQPRRQGAGVGTMGHTVGRSTAVAVAVAVVRVKPIGPK